MLFIFIFDQFTFELSFLLKSAKANCYITMDLIKLDRFILARDQ